MINTHQNVLFIGTVLALCVISLVHMFLFPVYGVRPAPSAGRTVTEFEQSLCMTNLKRTRAAGIPGAVARGAGASGTSGAGGGDGAGAEEGRRRRCPQDGVVTVMQGGRLGNQLWEYASVWAVSRRTGLEPFVPRCIRQRLDQVFESLTVPTLEEVAHCPLRLDALVPSLDTWTYTNQSIVLPRYAALADLVLTWLPDLLQELTFRRRLREQSARVLTAAAAACLPPGTGSTSQVVYVGVHVRRTDYLSYLWRKHRVPHAHAPYFFRAMDYFEAKYRPVVFVVISDDPAWCRQHLVPHRSSVYVASRQALSTPGQDLAVMAACNHSIIDYGTFGVWGAILAGGETLLYNVTNHAAALRLADIMPNWQTLS